METISRRGARRLALCRAGLLRPELTHLPSPRTRGLEKLRSAAITIISRFGYLQLDSIAVSGARSHALILMARLANLHPSVAEELLEPGVPIFEYWGHEASWLPMELYPTFEFRRRRFRVHPWWGDVISQHEGTARKIVEKVRAEGCVRSSELNHQTANDRRVMRQVLHALWSSGDLAIRRRVGFQRVYDLTERVIPQTFLQNPLDESTALEVLVLRALVGHGWATSRTLAATWRLKTSEHPVEPVLQRLASIGVIQPCEVVMSQDRRRSGWIRTRDLELLDLLEKLRPRRDRGVLLTPFDPILWDRARVRELFGFNQVLEIYKPASQRVYGYYTMPVLAGEHLVARIDLRFNRTLQRLEQKALHFETDPPSIANREAVRSAVRRHAAALGAEIEVIR